MAARPSCGRWRAYGALICPDARGAPFPADGDGAVAASSSFRAPATTRNRCAAIGPNEEHPLRPGLTQIVPLWKQLQPGQSWTRVAAADDPSVVASTVAVASAMLHDVVCSQFSRVPVGQPPGSPRRRGNGAGGEATASQAAEEALLLLLQDPANAAAPPSPTMQTADDAAATPPGKATTPGNAAAFVPDTLPPTPSKATPTAAWLGWCIATPSWPTMPTGALPSHATHGMEWPRRKGGRPF